MQQVKKKNSNQPKMGAGSHHPPPRLPSSAMGEPEAQQGLGLPATLCIFIPLLLPGPHRHTEAGMSLWFPCMDQDTEAQRGSVVCPKSHSQELRSRVFDNTEYLDGSEPLVQGKQEPRLPGVTARDLLCATEQRCKKCHCRFLVLPSGLPEPGHWGDRHKGDRWTWMGQIQEIQKIRGYKMKIAHLEERSECDEPAI